MPFITPIDGDPAIAEHIAQLTETLSGTRSIPVVLSSALTVPLVQAGTGGSLVLDAQPAGASLLLRTQGTTRWAVDANGHLSPNTDNVYDIGTPSNKPRYTYLRTTSMQGDLTFIGTGRRILGDFSTAPAASRLLFQTTTSNTFTDVGIMPSGTGTSAYVTTWGGSDVANASSLSVGVDATSTFLSSHFAGTGSVKPLVFYVSALERLRIETNGTVKVIPGGDLKVGAGGLATTATSGFLCLPYVNGTPTGAPPNAVDSIPVVFDLSTGRLYVSYGSAWHYVQFV